MGKNERGQVGVVVAILMVSLFVAVMVLVQIYYVPNWMKDREADHMDTVANQFSQIKASIDIESMAQRDMSLINSITLGSKELPFFVSARAFGSLNILSTSSSEFQVSVEGSGLPSTGMSDVEKANGAIPYVRSLSSFDLQLNGSQLSDGDYFNATVGTAYVNVTVSDFSTEFWQIDLRVANQSATPVYDRAIAWIAKNTEYTVNLLDDAYKLSTRILPYLSTPFNMSFTSISGGNFVVSGSRYDPNGNIASITKMGTIEYSSENAYFVDQTYVYEGGAVILNQSQGQAVISAPSFSIQNVTRGGDAMHLCSLGLVDVNGLAGKTSVSGYGTYSIKTNYSTMEEHEYIASTIYLNVTTSHVAAWQRYMNNTLSRAGIGPSSFTITNTTNTVTVALHGPMTDGTYDIKLTTTRTNIRAQVGPGWVS